MLNVLHVIKRAGLGSTERYVVSLAEKLKDDKCNFHLVYSEKGTLVSKMKELGAKTSKINMRNPFDFRAAWLLKKYCKENSIDIVHTHFRREAFISVLAKIMGGRFKLVASNFVIHGDNFVFRLFNRLMSLWIDKVITGSQGNKEILIMQGVLEKKITIIRGGVDLDLWQGPARKTIKIRKQLGLELDDFVVACVSNFSENEGLYFLLESVKQIDRMIEKQKDNAIKKIKFVLVGEGETTEQCKAMAQMLGISQYIVFTGYREDVKDIFKSSNLFVVPGHGSSMAIPVLEALACDLPVVSVESDSSSEIITQEEYCGLVADSMDSVSFAKGILKFIKDREFYQKCRENACNIVRQKYGIQKTVDETYKIYSE